jgi:putative chitobiose transport system permease protein
VETEAISTRQRRNGRWALLIAVPAAILSIAPLAWSVVSSLRPTPDILSTLFPLSWETFFPTALTLENYEGVLSGNFLAALGNSVIVTAASIVIGLLLSSTAAFALAVLPFRGRGFVFSLMVVSFLIPFEAIAIPLSSSFRDLGLSNSYLGLILPAVGNGLAIFLLRQFFLGIPASLSEAARMDGLSWFGIYWRIYLPLSRSAMVGAGLIIFVFQWQSFLWPLLIAPSPQMKVASVAIADFAQELGVDYGQMFAGAVLTALVPLALMLIFQRQFTGSLASSGSKE